MQITTNIQVQSPDLLHQIGQALLYPISTTLGRSYHVEQKVQELPEDSLLKRVTVAALAILAFPITLIAGAIGALLLQFSATHKNAYDQIEGSRVTLTWQGHRPEIRTKQLLLRPIQPSDLPVYQALFNSRVAMQHYRGGARDITQRFQGWIDRWQEHSFSALAVVDSESNQVIGHTVVGHGDWEGDRERGWTEMAVVIDPTYWNSDHTTDTCGKKGIGTEVTRACVAYARALREKGFFVPSDVGAEYAPIPEDLQVHRNAQGHIDWVLLPLSELRATTARANIAGQKILDKVFLRENGGVKVEHAQERDLYTLNLAT